MVLGIVIVVTEHSRKTNYLITKKLFLLPTMSLTMTPPTPCWNENMKKLIRQG